MNIKVNGSPEEVPADTSIASVLEATTGESDPEGVAVALNGTVVRRKAWSGTRLHEGDTLEVVRAMAGG